MGLMALINTENDKNYISLKEAIELLAKETNSNIWEVSTYLLNKDMYIHLYSHSRSTDHKIVQTSFEAYQGGETTWVGDNDAFSWLQYIAENEMQSYSARTITKFAKYHNGCIETYWERKAFFENKDIKEALKLSNTIFEPIVLEKEEQVSYEEYYLNLSIPSQEPDYHFWDDIKQYLNDEDKKNDISQQNISVKNPAIECTVDEEYKQKNQELLKKIEQLEHKLHEEKSQSSLLILDYQSLQVEVEKLKEKVVEKDAQIEQLAKGIQKESSEAFELILDKHRANNEISQLKTRIEQLESEQLHTKQKTSNLLDLIFDETKIERYAPDLVYCIQLWEHLYIENETEQGNHTNKANFWIIRNTPYKDKNELKVKRLREITSPFESWHVDRRKKFNK
ncbi:MULTISPECIES: hypothetical protein [unclassified Acinetobacter]|uniref:hypothetical protein n=1 Tax=unclassified Acinetobacter TaxID=196816 RepID=UPI002934F92A|nr:MULTISPECIES: hypothetical protein [unclassified Acinetobacter]WOE31020.1 hypothetical protein QSG84_11800 [Acinetobacter sp. SAAs470]WOE39216.1 hypothetical protein QSG86_05465 [Acinetobacter sp. SAAs474]